MHLVFLVHGLFGNPAHLQSMQDSLEAAAAARGAAVRVYRAQTVATTRSFDGLATNAERLYVELLAQIAETHATHLSLVGYSMGGLCVRYLAGMLLEDGVLDRVRPVVFATFATPHLGSQFVGNSVFGTLFNLCGPFLVGPSGFDLFRRNGVLAALADPTRAYYRALQRFEHLYLFANGVSDRTVHFWTAFIGNKNPFNDCERAAVCTYEPLPVFVDLECSRFAPAKGATSFNELGRTVGVGIVLPIFLTVLVFFLIGMSSYAWAKHALGLARMRPDQTHRHRASERMFAALQTALETALPDGTEPTDDAESEHRVDESVRAASAPGYAGFLDSCPHKLPLARDVEGDIAALNQLPWQKFVVVLPRVNTHSQIVDRRGGTEEGKLVMDFFAQKVVRALRRTESAASLSASSASSASAALVKQPA